MIPESERNFSKLTQVTVRMLRYYDETGLLKACQD